MALERIIHIIYMRVIMSLARSCKFWRLKWPPCRAPVLGHSWVQIPLRTWILVRILYVVLTCLSWGLAMDGLILSKESISSTSQPQYLSPSRTRCSRVLIQKLTVSQLLKKFPVFYGTRFINRVHKNVPLVPILSPV